MAQKKFIIDGGFSTNAESSINGNLLMTGSIIPSVDSNGVTGYDLGSTTAKWRDLYLSQGSLYIDGQKVLQSDSGTIVVSADVDQSLLTKTTGAGVLTFQSPNPIAISGTLQMGTGKRITSADGLAVVFGDKIDMDANQIINVANPTTAQGVATKDYVDVQIGNILNGAPDALNTLNELAAALGDDANFSATVTNALALKAATTYVDSQDTATLNAAKAYSDGLAFGTGSDLSATNSRVTTNEAEIDALQADMATAQADILANASDIADNAAAITAAISTAASDATTKADAALVSANAYTDTRETAITSAYTAAIATAVEAKDEINELADVNITAVSNGQFLRYDLGSNKWVNVTASTTMIQEGTNLFYTDARVGSYLTANSYATQAYVDSVAEAKDQLSELSGTSDDITEGTTNKFFTEQRARDAVAQDIADAVAQKDELGELADINITAVSNGQFLRYDLGSNKWVNVTANTTMIAEGTKLFFTDARAQAAVAGDISSAVAAEAALREAADTSIRSDFASADATTLASAQTYADTAADTAESNANAYTDIREADITTNYQDYADAAEADAITSANATTTEKIGDATVDGTLGNTVNDRIATSLASAQSYTDTRETAITTAYQAADSGLQTQLNTEKGRIDAILTASTADKDTFAEIVTFINSVDTENDNALGTEITTRAAADATLQTNIDNEATARIAGDAATIANAQTYADQAEADAVTTANAYTDGRETAITTAYQTYADSAEADAVTTANAYTDGRETAITTAYQTYADSAEADAITSANAYTDGRETAITTAYQTYADSAEVDAKAYTDTRETAITTAYTSAIATSKAASDAYADQAEVDAKAYTDTRETAITTAYQTYADQAEVDAKAYTDTRETAITTAYTSAIATAVAGKDNTDEITEGSTNLYFTDARAQAAVAGDIASAVAVETARIDAILLAADADKDSFAEIVTFINAVDTTNDTALGTEITTRAAADTALQADIDTRLLASHDMTLTLSGDVSGSATFTNMGNATLTVTVADDSHNHIIGNVDGLQAALDAKADDATTFTAGAGLTGGGTLGANRTFNVGAGTGITVAADSVSVDTTWSDARYVQPANLENFHSSPVTITSANATTNASGTLTLTFSELSGAVHYNVYLNRILLRPTEFSISGTSVIIALGVVATDDEVEVTGLKLV